MPSIVLPVLIIIAVHPGEPIRVKMGRAGRPVNLSDPNGVQILEAAADAREDLSAVANLSNPLNLSEEEMQEGAGLPGCDGFKVPGKYQPLVEKTTLDDRASLLEQVANKYLVALRTKMTKHTFYLMRHGEALHNPLPRGIQMYFGDPDQADPTINELIRQCNEQLADTPLLAKGVNDAKTANNILERLTDKAFGTFFDVMLVSPNFRTLETAFWALFPNGIFEESKLGGKKVIALPDIQEFPQMLLTSNKRTLKKDVLKANAMQLGRHGLSKPGDANENVNGTTLATLAETLLKLADEYPFDASDVKWEKVPEESREKAQGFEQYNYEKLADNLQSAPMIAKRRTSGSDFGTQFGEFIDHGIDWHFVSEERDELWKEFGTGTKPYESPGEIFERVWRFLGEKVPESLALSGIPPKAEQKKILVVSHSMFLRYLTFGSHLTQIVIKDGMDGGKEALEEKDVPTQKIQGMLGFNIKNGGVYEWKY